MPGPRPKPTVLKKLQGNPGKRALNKREPKPRVVALMEPPAWMGKHGREEWVRVVRELPRGMVTVLDRAVLENYCAAYDEWRTCLTMIKKYGRTQINNGRRFNSPYVSQCQKARIDLNRFAAELGFTPSARSKVKGDHGESDSEADREFADIVGI